jgi:SAM-dependent methyltransferase
MTTPTTTNAPSDPAARAYAERTEAFLAQRARLTRYQGGFERWSRHAPSYRFDPRRPLDANLRVLASYVEPDDVVLEIGGGAGRIALPLAQRCRHVTNVEPADGMRKAFLELAADAGIDNVSAEGAAWPPSDDHLASMRADVVLVVDVTYFVPDIAPFLAAMNRAARRRAIVSIWAVPPPAIDAPLFEAAFGEPQIPAPGQAELLPVLWEMGILPDVLVLPDSFTWPERSAHSPDEAVTLACELLEPLDQEAATERVRAQVDDLFTHTGDAYRPAWRSPSRGVLITWEPAG